MVVVRHFLPSVFTLFSSSENKPTNRSTTAMLWNGVDGRDYLVPGHPCSDTRNICESSHKARTDLRSTDFEKILLVFLCQKRHPIHVQPWQKGRKRQKATCSREFHRRLWHLNGSHKFLVVSCPFPVTIVWNKNLPHFDSTCEQQVFKVFVVLPSDFPFEYGSLTVRRESFRPWFGPTNMSVFDVPGLEFFDTTGEYQDETEWLNSAGTWFRQIIPTGCQLIHFLEGM